MIKQQIAKLNYLHIAPRKVRLIAALLKGLSVNEAEAQLLFGHQRSNKPLLKLLRSAVANAKHNQKLDPDKLVIKDIRVDQGPMLKRLLPRAMGRATEIQKKMSHVTLTLEERHGLPPARFNIAIPKKSKASKKEKTKFPKDKVAAEQKEIVRQREKSGFLKRLFRRKSI